MRRPRAKASSPAKNAAKRPKASVTVPSTAGTGFDFEDHVATWLLAKMLAGEEMPAVKVGYGERLQAQTSSLNWVVDDHLVTCGKDFQGPRLALSCKANRQVSSQGLPEDFVEAAWKQYSNGDQGPFKKHSDCIALVTKGHVPQFEAVWARIKSESVGSDPALALARIKQVGNRKTIFDNITGVVKRVDSTVSDEAVLDFVRHLFVIPRDFHLDVSEDTSATVLMCRKLLSTGASDQAKDLWQCLIEQARECRLGKGTIDIPELWRELRSRFSLQNHPDFGSDWSSLEAMSREHLSKIEAALPTGHILERQKNYEKLTQAIGSAVAIIVYGESGTGKSSIAKSALSKSFPSTNQVWLDPDALSAIIPESKRRGAGLQNPVGRVLDASIHRVNVLVLDSAERISDELVPQVTKLIQQLLASNKADDPPAWRVLLIGQTDAWSTGRLQGLLAGHSPLQIEIGPLSSDDVRSALRSSTSFEWLANDRDAVAALTNLKALAWLMSAGSYVNQSRTSVASVPAIADLLWRFWTADRVDLQGLLMRLAERDGFFEHSIGISEFLAADAAAYQSRPPQLPLRQTTRNRIEFQHDLAADWARFQWLKEISNDMARWAQLAQNPLWASALRLLGQFLLREGSGTATEWDTAFAKLSTAKDVMVSAADVLLDALCLDPNAEKFLSDRAELLFANEGELLRRLLARFHHIASIDTTPLLFPQVDPTLSLYLAARNRYPIIARWPPVIRFLSAYQSRLASLLSSDVAKFCERWLTSIPEEWVAGKRSPYRHELAAISVETARELQLEQQTRRFVSNEVERPIYAAALAAAPDLPEEIGGWVLEMAQRRPTQRDIVEKVAAFRRQQAAEHQAKLKADGLYRDRYKRLSGSVFPSPRQLPPWPHGPKFHVERDFRETCTRTQALAPLMRARPSVAAEVLLAVLVEDPPEEDYGRRLDRHYGMEFDRHSYPTAYWVSPFYIFLQIAPNEALTALLELVNFATERWMDRRDAADPNTKPISLTFSDDSSKDYVGDINVFDWGHTSDASSGQLYCALAALEKWLCDCISNDIDASGLILRILDTGRSVAFVGVLINVAKSRPALLDGVLRPLLTCLWLYLFDKNHVSSLQVRFDGYAWKRQGEVVYQKAYEWWSMPYRHRTLQQIVIDLLRSSHEAAETLKKAVTRWAVHEKFPDWLDVRILAAELDSSNHAKRVDQQTGEQTWEIIYPPELQEAIDSYNQAAQLTNRAWQVPGKCENLLGSPGTLSERQAGILETFLRPGEVFGPDHIAEKTASIAAATTLLVKAKPWLEAHPNARTKAEAVVKETIGKIGEGIEFLQQRAIGGRVEFNFAAHAAIDALVDSPHDAGAARAVLATLTSGVEGPIEVLTRIAYHNRMKLGMIWWRLLELAVLWCALTALSPRPHQSQGLPRLWESWLAWLRRRGLSDAPGSVDRIDLVRVSVRVERLLRWRFVKEFEREDRRFRGGLQSRRFVGLDTHFLAASFAWLLKAGPNAFAPLNPAEQDQHIELLLRLMKFELSLQPEGDEDSSDKPLSHFGYDLIPAIANAVVHLDHDKASLLWQPILELGGRAHYVVEQFINSWLHRDSGTIEVPAFALHWRSMLEFALGQSKWGFGARWYQGEALLCKLLGCGSELWLDQIPEMAAVVSGMKDLFATWADVHLGREEDNIGYFCGLLSSPSGRLIRLDGLTWLHRTVREKVANGRASGRTRSVSALIGLLDTALTENASEIAANSDLRNVVLELIAFLVAQQVHAALQLQERAKVKLAGR